jgi:hypothetical protein
MVVVMIIRMLLDGWHPLWRRLGLMTIEVVDWTHNNVVLLKRGAVGSLRCHVANKGMCIWIKSFAVMFRWVVLVFGERHNYYMPAGSRMSEGRYCATWLRENQSFDEEQDEPIYYAVVVEEKTLG